MPVYVQYTLATLELGLGSKMSKKEQKEKVDHCISGTPH